jgi:rubrerythrin
LFAPDEILDLAIQLERNGEGVYRQAMEKFAKPELTALLGWMADEEVKHAQWFAELKKMIQATSNNPFIKEMSRELFNDLLGGKNFSHREVDFALVEEADELMAIFIEFEKDTILFYEILKPFIIEEGTLETLKKIIAEEHNHITRLKQFTENDAALAVADDLRERFLG